MAGEGGGETREGEGGGDGDNTDLTEHHAVKIKLIQHYDQGCENKLIDTFG